MLKPIHYATKPVVMCVASMLEVLYSAQVCTYVCTYVQLLCFTKRTVNVRTRVHNLYPVVNTLYVTCLVYVVSTHSWLVHSPG